MSSIIFRTFTGGLLIALALSAHSTSPLPNAEMAAVLLKLSENTNSDQFSQISGAIAASPKLVDQMNELAASKKVTEIRISPFGAIQPPQGNRFGASLNGTQLVLAANLLAELQNSRNHDVIRPNDVLPNNTTFVIGHLAFHAKTSDDMAKSESDVMRLVDARRKTDGQHDYTDLILFGQRIRIENEASAFIQGWNYVVDAATEANGGKTLTMEQISSLILNLRYRFAFVKALQLKDNGIQISNTGMIQMNERNIKAVATALSTSRLADIQ